MAASLIAALEEDRSLNVGLLFVSIFGFQPLPVYFATPRPILTDFQTAV